jgi:4-diphosphocytidyl-2-C-methyl-D-erythritol kinase
MRTACLSPGKINLLLNILGRRPDGFHELETILQPLSLADELEFESGGSGVRLSCNVPDLPIDSGNLVFRAASVFLERAGIRDGVAIRLEKRLPLEAGLGGGSSNAAATLTALNRLYGEPLMPEALQELAAGLGSDVPFFLQPGPALGRGRGEVIEPLHPFEALRGAWVLLVHPGFGVSTPSAYRALAEFPELVRGRAGRARELVEQLREADLRAAGEGLFNALEAPVLRKYPILQIFQEFLAERGASGVLMSGSGSTTFSLWRDESEAREAEGLFRERFGSGVWTAVSMLPGCGSGGPSCSPLDP